MSKLDELMDALDKLNGLNHLLQYRAKVNGIAWLNMTAFDFKEPAENYLE